MLAAALLLLIPLGSFQQEEAEEPTLYGRATAFRVDRIETLDGETLENATLVVRDGVIEKMGSAVLIPEQAEVHDLRGRGATILPPLVFSHANFLVEDNRRRGKYGRFRAVDSVRDPQDSLQELLEEGILLVGVDPPGSGVAGRTSVMTTAGEDGFEVLVRDLHLKMTLDVNSSAKELIRSSLKAADQAIEKEKKAKEEWQKARKAWEEKQKAKQEAAKKEAEKKGKEGEQGKPESSGGNGDKDKPKGGKEEDKEPPKEFVPPKIDPNLVPVVEWIRQERLVQIWLDNASEWIHWVDLLGDRELPYEVVLRHSSWSSLPTQDFHEVLEEIQDAGVRVYVPAVLTAPPYTRYQVNLPADLAAGGSSLVLLPRNLSLRGVREWRVGLADLVREGMDRQTLLKAISTEAAAALGHEEMVAPLKVGGPATFTVFGGDVLDPVSKVDFVVRDGHVVYDRKKEEEKKEGSR
ncbi:MAG: hypothetical protein DWQ01_20180 [Planctomycetota bacterium]|nr:MAG: hypothetical protein DWQ01_20180 [Planctomycetota bacterium]